MSNDRPVELMQGINATPEQKDEAFRINQEMRFLALKFSPLVMAAISALTIFPPAGFLATSRAISR